MNCKCNTIAYKAVVLKLIGPRPQFALINFKELEVTAEKIKIVWSLQNGRRILEYQESICKKKNYIQMGSSSVNSTKMERVENLCLLRVSNAIAQIGSISPC